MMKLFAAIGFALVSSAASAAAPGAGVAELMGFETVKVGAQEVRVAVTKETSPNGISAYCRQTVRSYTHEIVAAGALGQEVDDKTTIVLGKTCRANEKS